MEKATAKEILEWYRIHESPFGGSWADINIQKHISEKFVASRNTITRAANLIMQGVFELPESNAGRKPKFDNDESVPLQISVPKSKKDEIVKIINNYINEKTPNLE